MYVITRQDLSPGAQIAQVGHVCFSFALEHLNIITLWNKNSNYIAILAAKDEQELWKLKYKLEAEGLKFSIFREEDFNNELTAIAIEPSDKARKLTSSYPLALKRLSV